MLGLKSHRQTLLNPPGTRIPTPFLIVLNYRITHTAFQRAPVSVSTQSKEQREKNIYFTSKDLKCCFIFIIQGSP